MMGGKMNLKIIVEKTNEMGVPENKSYYQSELEHLLMEILLSIEELVQLSPGRRIEYMTKKRTNGKIVVNMQIASDELEEEMLVDGVDGVDEVDEDMIYAR